ncbi:MAG: proteasome subunit beta [Candidatus Lokiarchaeota archaeon]|nr:proteasome subunit beta [Candidatus Lokiarchaeota archaeon]
MKQGDFRPYRSQFDIDVQVINEELIEKRKMEIEKKLKTGTTTVGLVCKDGVVLAADKRATMGLFVANKNAEKLHLIQSHVWMTIAGSVADAQYLIEILRAESNVFKLTSEKPMTAKAIATYLSRILNYYKGYFQVGLIIGGYGSEGPALFQLGAYGSIIPEKITAIGSGSPYAIGLLEAQWHENLTVDEGIKIAAAAVRSSIIRDVFTGNGIDVVAIRKDSYEQKFFGIETDPLTILNSPENKT